MKDPSFTCYDSTGRVLKYLYQWDSNRKIRFRFTINSDEGSPVNIMGNNGSLVDLYMHFCTHRMHTTYDVQCQRVPVVDGLEVPYNYECTIPNELLVQPDNLKIYLRQKFPPLGGTEERTLASVVIPIIQRPMPEEYAYREDITPADDLSLEDGILSLSLNGIPFGTSVEIPTDI